MIALDGVAPPVKMSFTIGDSNGTGGNPNDVAWDSTKRTLSFWHQGGFSKLQVLLTSSAGEKKVTYNSGTGINGHTGNNVDIYLGTTGSTSWHRFERNIEADYELYAGGATWTNTDGLVIIPDATYGSYDMNVDDIRLSNSVTVEHNTLGPGVIGHILRNTTWDDTSSLAREDKWFHYDQVGSVLSVSDETGDLAVTHQQDAFGNVMGSWSEGLWESLDSDPHLGGESALYGIYIFYSRMYSPQLGLFMSRSSFYPLGESAYSYTENQPTTKIDPSGELSFTPAELKVLRQLPVEQYPPAAICTLGAVHQTNYMTEDAYGGRAREPQQNAMRHCVWSCCLTKSLLNTNSIRNRFPLEGWLLSKTAPLGSLSGPALASRILNAHETSSTDTVDSYADRINNRIGMGFGLGNSPRGYCGGDSCIEKCFTALNSGGLQLRPTP